MTDDYYGMHSSQQSHDEVTERKIHTWGRTQTAKATDTHTHRNYTDLGKRGGSRIDTQTHTHTHTIAVKNILSRL